MLLHLEIEISRTTVQQRGIEHIRSGSHMIARDVRTRSVKLVRGESLGSLIEVFIVLSVPALKELVTGIVLRSEHKGVGAYQVFE